MKKEFKNLAKLLIPFTVALFVVQYFIQIKLFATINFFYTTSVIYIFHFMVTFLLLSGLIAVKNSFFDKTGLAFMVFGLLKMMASVVFLLPLIQAENNSYIPDVIAFFVPYFLFLLFDIFFSIKLLNSIPKD